MPDNVKDQPIEENTSQDPQTIFVDMDGTLIRTDLYFESFLKAFKEKPLHALKAVLLLFKGRAQSKTLTARHGPIDASILPYNLEVIDHLRGEKACGKKIILATAAHRNLAQRVADHLGFFDGVIATTAKSGNIKSRAKLAKIKEHMNGEPFSYAGDSTADATIWAESAGAIFVDAPSAEISKAKQKNIPHEVFKTKAPYGLSLLKAMRPHQWVKNFLVFTPLLASHSYGDMNAVFLSVLAFISFSLCASGVYLTNDLLDVEADRRHPTKKNRPFASGDLYAPHGLVAALIAYVAAFAVALTVSPKFFITLIVYFIATTLYSLWIKRKPAMDVITLAGLYTIRIIAGGYAIGVEISFWLLAFSMFAFLSLAYMKRYTELDMAEHAGALKAPGRGYYVEDKEGVFTLGSISGFISVLVVALFINSESVAAAYPVPEALWLLCPALLYWMNRIWFGARRGKIHEDPIVFALRDKVSLFVAIFCGLVILFARYGSI